MIRRLRDLTNLPLPSIRISPWWIWKIHFRDMMRHHTWKDVRSGSRDWLQIFRNRKEVRSDGNHFRWGFQFIGFEFGNRG